MLLFDKINNKKREAQLNVNSRETDFVHRKGGGINDWIKKKIAVTDKNDTTSRLIFTIFGKVGPVTKFPPSNWLLKKLFKFGDTYNTKGYSIPLQVDTTVQSLNIPIDYKKDIIKPPIELMIDAVKKAESIVILNECTCRKIGDCKDYPTDLGCMFIGKAAEVCIKNGIAHKATADEAISHINRAKESGLSAGAYWVEREEYVWGFEDVTIPDFLAFCFCCPCCCNPLKFEVGASGELKQLMHKSVGWHCEPIPANCKQCGLCIETCPRELISLKKGKISIKDSCAGCGQCLKACKNGALHVVQYADTKDNLSEYFDKIHAKW